MHTDKLYHLMKVHPEIPDPAEEMNDNRRWECELEGNNDKDFAALDSTQRSAVYFKDSNAENVVIRDVHIDENMTSAVADTAMSEA